MATNPLRPPKRHGTRHGQLPSSRHWRDDNCAQMFIQISLPCLGIKLNQVDLTPGCQRSPYRHFQSFSSTVWAPLDQGAGLTHSSSYSRATCASRLALRITMRPRYLPNGSGAYLTIHIDKEGVKLWINRLQKTCIITPISPSYLSIASWARSRINSVALNSRPLIPQTLV